MTHTCSQDMRVEERMLHVPQVGSQASSAELLGVKQYLQTCRRRVDVVSPGWLLLCGEEQRLVPGNDPRCRLNLGSLLAHVAAAGAAPGSGAPLPPAFAAAGAAGGGGGSFSSASAAAAGSGIGGGGMGTAVGGGSGTNSMAGVFGGPGLVTAAPGSAASMGVFANTASRHGPPLPGSMAAEAAAATAWIPQYWLEQPVDRLRAFEGCHFTLVALQATPEHERALTLVRCVVAAVQQPPHLHVPPIPWAPWNCSEPCIDLPPVPASPPLPVC